MVIDHRLWQFRGVFGSSVKVHRESLRAVRNRTLLLVSILTLTPFTVWGSEPNVVITLARHSVIRQSEIRLDEIALIRGESNRLPVPLREIDLGFVNENDTKLLSLNLIRLRLALANYPMDQIRIQGPAEISVSYETVQANLTVTFEEILKRQISSRLHLTPDQLRIQSLRPLEQVFRKETLSHSQIEQEVDIPAGPILGNRTVTVRGMLHGEVLETRAIPVEVSVKQELILVTRPISQGELITWENVTSRHAFVTTFVEEIPLKSVLGQVARRPLHMGEQLDRRDLVIPTQQRQGEILVQPRDAIRLIARKNNLEFVVPQAEALQAGREGQIIRVKNIQSNRIVNARVISPEEAVVDLQ